MGGNVFKDITRRYSAAEYFALVDDVLGKMVLLSNKCTIIPAYKNKPSFGDMDVLFIPNGQVSAEKLDTMFGCGPCVINNGGVWSLVYKEFQIDLITTTTEEFDYSLVYFSANDAQNLVGRYSHKMGLKHGHNGLWWPVRSNDHVLGEVLLTLEPVVALKFLDCALPSEWFNTVEDIFKYVASSKYFNPDIFLLENRNHTSRVRDRKRPTYTAFLEWCKTQTLKGESEYYHFDKDKSVYHRKIFKAFPHAKKEFDALWARKFLIEEAASKFNGRLVKEWTGRDGVELGNIMRVLKVDLTPENIVVKTPDEIYNMVMENHIQMKELENV